MHEIMTGFWSPNTYDTARGIAAGFGATINILEERGENDCGYTEPTTNATTRQTFYERFCSLFNVSPGNNLDCTNMESFDNQGSAYL